MPSLTVCSVWLSLKNPALTCLSSSLVDPSFGGKYLAMTDEDKFPILVKRDDMPGMVSVTIIRPSAIT